MDDIKDRVMPYLHWIWSIISTDRDLSDLNWWQITLALIVVVGVANFCDYLFGVPEDFAHPDGTDEELNDELESWRDAAQRPEIPPPTEIVSLRIYPIKSCRGFEVPASQLMQSGLQLDRNWMLIDRTTREFLTIRNMEAMTLIDTKLVYTGDSRAEEDTSLQISIKSSTPGTPSPRITIPAFPTRAWLEEHTTLSKVIIWEEETDGWEYSEAINAVFTQFFGASRQVALVYKGPSARLQGINGKEELYGSAVPHHFADVMSVLVASEASMRDLNVRLGHTEEADPAKLTIERFRPNIIVRGREEQPWEEDTWKSIRIVSQEPSSTITTDNDEKPSPAPAGISLDVLARCARCHVPNVDPATATKDPRQPWSTLMQFRRVDDGGAAKYKPCFGMLCVPTAAGRIAVGDRLECLQTTSRHVYNDARFEDL